MPIFFYLDIVWKLSMTKFNISHSSHDKCMITQVLHMLNVKLGGDYLSVMMTLCLFKILRVIPPLHNLLFMINKIQNLKNLHCSQDNSKHNFWLGLRVSRCMYQITNILTLHFNNQFTKSNMIYKVSVIIISIQKKISPRKKTGQAKCQRQYLKRIDLSQKFYFNPHDYPDFSIITNRRIDICNISTYMKRLLVKD